MADGLQSVDRAEGRAEDAERIIAARRSLQARPGIDGDGIQLSVDLDVMLLEAGIHPEDADGLTDGEIRTLPDPCGENAPSGLPDPKAA